MSRARTTLAAALLVLLSGCAGEPGAVPQEPTDDPTTDPAGPGRTTTADPQSAPLDWQPTGGSPVDRRIVGAEWSALVERRGGSVTLTRDGEEVVVAAGKGRRVSEVLMDDEWALVVAHDETGRSTPATAATAVDLGTGERHSIGGSSLGPGPWALHEGRVFHGSYGQGGSYCLAATVLASAGRAGSSGPGDLTGYCAARRHGFSGVTATEHGLAMMTFDDRRPASCRTLGTLDDEASTFTPIREVPECGGWDVALLESGPVWSVVEDAHRQDEGRFFAHYRDQVLDLGAGTTGTLVPCGDSAYFTVDPQQAGDPARLMRWSPKGVLEAVYETSGDGQAFLAPPDCAGRVLTLSAFAEGGDEQVYAEVP